MDDVSGVQVTNNSINGYNFALCVQTKNANVYGNDVVNSCFGAFVDPGVTGARILNNHISNSSIMCATIPREAVGGITIFGASQTEAKGNLIEGMRVGQLVNATAGISVLDDLLRFDCDKQYGY
jgi:hypothetical protein